MLDRAVLRKEGDRVIEAASSKGEPCPLEEWQGLDSDRRAILQKVERLRKSRNEMSAEVARLKKAGQDAEELMEMSRATGREISLLESELEQVDNRLSEVELLFPNIPDPDVPRGDPSMNLTVREWGSANAATGSLKPHWELMGDAFDQEASARVTGANFILLRGWAARLQRVLIDWMLEYHSERGMQEVWTPFLALPDSMRTTAQLPKLEDDMYLVEREGLYLVPTGEVPITNIYRDQIIPEADLPVRLCGYTPCFRREAGSYGADTRGLNRVHQFEKVEIVSIVRPDESEGMLEEMCEHVESMLRMLELPYRTRLLATGDLSFAAARCYDLEIWSAGQERWLEVSSVSNFRDFQARRGNIRFKPSSGGKPSFVHTLNGSGTALPRLLAAIVENGQRPDGSIELPELLGAAMGTVRIDPSTP